jgi:hypothetical protein
MSIPKEKIILLKIKEIMENPNINDDSALIRIGLILDDYKTPGIESLLPNGPCPNYKFPGFILDTPGIVVSDETCLGSLKKIRQRLQENNFIKATTPKNFALGYLSMAIHHLSAEFGEDPGYIGGPIVGEAEERYIPCPGKSNCSPARYTDKVCCSSCQHLGISTPVPMDDIVLIGVVGSIGDWPGMTFICNSCKGEHTGIQRHLISGNSVCPACALKKKSFKRRGKDSTRARG